MSEMRELTIDECRRMSADLALTNEIHAENRKRFAPGKRYSEHNPEDRRVYLDSVFIPEGYHMPRKCRAWYSTGGGYMCPGEPGQWMFNVGIPEATNDEPTLFDGVNS